MKILCEMSVIDYFKLPMETIAFVGYLKPNIDIFVPNCKADLYIGDEKIKSINIIGEDIFAGVDETKRDDRRAVRTDENISNELEKSNNKSIKLIFLIDK